MNFALGALGDQSTRQPTLQVRATFRWQHKLTGCVPSGLVAGVVCVIPPSLPRWKFLARNLLRLFVVCKCRHTVKEEGKREKVYGVSPAASQVHWHPYFPSAWMEFEYSHFQSCEFLVQREFSRSVFYVPFIFLISDRENKLNIKSLQTKSSLLVDGSVFLVTLHESLARLHRKRYG